MFVEHVTMYLITNGKPISGLRKLIKALAILLEIVFENQWWQEKLFFLSFYKYKNIYILTSEVSKASTLFQIIKAYCLFLFMVLFYFSK